MKDYKEEIMSIEQSKDKIKNSIINDIKETMNQYEMTCFVISDLDDEVKKGYEDEFDQLLDDVGNDMVSYSNETLGSRMEPIVLFVDDNGVLEIECWVFSTNPKTDYCYLHTSKLNENQIVKDIPLETLHQILLNVQNDKFHRINELIVRE